jgi:hypothetical protein
MTSKAREAYYSSYKSQNKWKSNREARLLRELKRSPNNAKQIEDAIANLSYRRKTPTTPTWSHSQIAMAKILKEFGGSAPLACFSSNESVARDAIAKVFKDHSSTKLPEGKVDFSLAARSYSKNPV